MLGQYRYSLDAKSRLFIPSRFRDEIGKDLVIVRDLRTHSLRGFSKAGFDEFMARVMALAQPYRDQFTRFYTRICAEVTADAQGRVIIGKDLLEYAAVNEESGRETIIVGCIDHFEIWSEKMYQTEVVEKEDIAALIADANALGF